MTISVQEYKNGSLAMTEITMEQGRVKAKFLNYGITMSSLMVDGVEVCLGFDDPLDYPDLNSPYFGQIIGRLCNRTKNGRFSLGGKEYQLPINNGPNSLHGGLKGLSKVYWNYQIISQEPPQVEFEYASNDLDDGYPGTVTFKCSWTLENMELQFTTEAQVVDAQESCANVTVHPYFNLSGFASPTVAEHVVDMDVTSVMKMDENQIPTGELLTERDRPEMFLKNQKIGDKLPSVKEFRGYDHYYFGKSIKVTCPRTRIQLQATFSYPGFQFYTGNWLDESLKAKRVHNKYQPYAGFCIEPSYPPNSINMPQFRDKVILKKGEKQINSITYKFSKDNQ
ncbi:hypothetical protein HK103_002239 [Boothiomyces macroporosus]|uniref:Aldose 1-epimerase n=1 Tax=Boothiomyces macroporosus TaxID=261099 RepID=A0AAD5Y0F9_9FUNG|nr:hypothetical protein HK103_002239 [Boothiomyces macroporosus]